MLAFTVTKDTINVVVGGITKSVPRDSMQAPQLMAELHKGEEASDEEVLRLLSPAASLVMYSKGDANFMADGSIQYKGETLPRVLADRIVSCMHDDVPYENLLKFFERLAANPSQRAIKELYSFLEHKKMPITPEGHFIAYKGLDEKYWSITGNERTEVIDGKTCKDGRIYNGVGETIRVQRNHVDDDARVGCASGLHAGSLEYAKGFARGKVVLVAIDPADVVSVPYDCSCQKLRTCAYKVIGDFVKELSDGGVDKNYAEFGGKAVYHFDSDPDLEVRTLEDELDELS